MRPVKKYGPTQIAFAVCGLAVALAAIWWLNKDSDAEDLAESSRNRWFICTETGKPFRHKLEVGMTSPVVSPHSGKPTAVLAALCYWTKDGTPKDDPTPVLLNESVGKKGPTFCPDCGRLLLPGSPMATAGSKPPPTQAEYTARRGAKSVQKGAASAR